MLSTSPPAGGTPSLPTAGAPLPPVLQARAFEGVWCPPRAAARHLLAGPSWEGRAANTHPCQAAFGAPFIYMSFNRSDGWEVPTFQLNHPPAPRKHPGLWLPMPFSSAVSSASAKRSRGWAHGVGAGGKCTPQMIALHCTVTTKKTLNVRECTKLWL